MNVEFYVLAFFISVFISLFSIPIVGSLAIRFNAIDKPSGRKIHRKEIPLWGGIAVFAGIFFTIFILKSANPEFKNLLIGNSGNLMKLLEGIFVAAGVIVAIGMVDDLKGMLPTTKLLGQIIAAMLVIQYGIKIEGFKLPFMSHYIEFPLYIGIAITVLWVIVFINSINLIDGIDGLATGVTAIATLIFFVITLYQLKIQTEPLIVDRLKLVSVLSLVLCGSCIGFLKFNFPPAKIFLGDSGSLLLGFMAGIITITGILKVAAAFTMFIPVIIFGFPIMDAGISFLRRVFNKKSFMEADKDHLHHRLLYRRGWNTKKVIGRIYTITVVLGVIAVLITIL
jgi:UDP-GlcNAc:undecaprenyl-phosphate GlcNAc-1-phosphate transferase